VNMTISKSRRDRGRSGIARSIAGCFGFCSTVLGPAVISPALAGPIAAGVLLGTATGSPAQSGPLQARASLQREEIALGDSVVYQITIDGVTSAPPPTLPSSLDYAVKFLGGMNNSMQSFTIVNGRRTEQNTLSYVLQWEITPSREGTINIQPVQIDINGKKLDVPAQRVTVKAAMEHPDYSLTLELDKTEAYVGEPIRARLVWMVGRQATLPTVRGPDGGDRFDIAALDPRPAANRNAPMQGEQYQQVPFLGGAAIIRREVRRVRGNSTSAWIIELAITPRQAGQLEIDPYTMVFEAVGGNGPRGLFDFPGDRRERVVVASQPISLRVKPLPETGRPADFSGLVGEFTMSAAAGNKEANVGGNRSGR
jgi:hypothetical protein